MESFVKQTLLYDFYGELLTDRQKQVYESVVLYDNSLGEAAEELGISRQGVHDMVKRCHGILEGYEEKLHLVERFLRIRSQVKEIEKLALSLPDGMAAGGETGREGTQSISEEIARISGEILEEL